MNCNRGLRSCWLFVLFCVYGCASWQAKPLPSELPPAKMSPESVEIEVTLVRIPPAEQDIEQSIWAEADEQCVSTSSRRQLNSNGILCGVVSHQLPARLRQLLDKNSATITDSGTIDVMSRMHREQWRSGQRRNYVTTSAGKTIVLLQQNENAAQLSGTTYDDAQGFISARAFPQPDGTVNVELIPEIHYGPIQRQWTAGEAGYQIEAGQQRKILDHLKMEVNLSLGQSLMVSSTLDAKGVGDALFVDRDNGDPQKKVFLIRLARTQRDELFDNLTDE